MNLNKKLHRIAQQGGFTLVEMLLVVAIISIIVSIAVPAMQDMKSEAQARKRAALTYAIQSAKERAVINGDLAPRQWATWNHFGKYVLVNGRSPTDLTEITSGEKNGTGVNIWHWGSSLQVDGTGTQVLFSNLYPAITSPSVWTMNP